MKFRPERTESYQKAELYSEVANLLAEALKHFSTDNEMCTKSSKGLVFDGRSRCFLYKEGTWNKDFSPLGQLVRHLKRTHPDQDWTELRSVSLAEILSQAEGCKLSTNLVAVMSRKICAALRQPDQLDTPDIAA